MNISAFDIVSIIILLILAVRGTFRGFVAEIMSMASVLVGIIIAVIFTHSVSILLQEYIGESFWNTVIAFLGLFLISYLIIKVFESSLNSIIEKVQLEKLDQSLGFFLGLIEGFLFIIILVFILRAQPLIVIDKMLENSFSADISDKIIPIGTKIIQGKMRG